MLNCLIMFILFILSKKENVAETFFCAKRSNARRLSQAASERLRNSNSSTAGLIVPQLL